MGVASSRIGVIAISAAVEGEARRAFAQRDQDPPPSVRLSRWQRFCPARNAGELGLIPLEGLNVRPFEVGSGKFGTPCARMHLAKRSISAKFSAFWAADGAWYQPVVTSALQSRSAASGLRRPGSRHARGRLPHQPACAPRRLDLDSMLVQAGGVGDVARNLLLLSDRRRAPAAAGGEQAKAAEQRDKHRARSTQRARRPASLEALLTGLVGFDEAAGGEDDGAGPRGKRQPRYYRDLLSRTARRSVRSQLRMQGHSWRLLASLRGTGTDRGPRRCSLDLRRRR